MFIHLRISTIPRFFAYEGAGITDSIIYKPDLNDHFFCLQALKTGY